MKNPPPKQFRAIFALIIALTFYSRQVFVFCTENEAEPDIDHYGNGTSITTDTEFRLPLSIIPVNYKLEVMTILDPQSGFERFTAPGKVWIRADCKDATSIITLHSANLTINKDTIRVSNVITGNNEEILGLSLNEENDFLHIELANVTQIFEQYEIYIEFIAPISQDRLNGIYLDVYDDPNSGERRYIATTLFAPYHARRAFPCFDEPHLRATYDITVGHHNKYHAMSNTEIIETKPIGNMTDWQWDSFKTTPSISSYITAMIVSDLEFEEAPQGSFRNVSIRVYAKPESIKQGAAAYSARLTGDVMTYFESLFIATFPISKLYSVALPQFFFSAMENWGLITFKEPVLLYLPGETTEEERYKINYVLSHENAHQHFGNLVACKWWAYVWLKEGFSTYFSHYGMNHTNPEFLPWEQFIPTILQVAMEFDSSNETHPLENYPPTSADVAGIYTDIPYEKGASILRMGSSIVTESVFLDGIRLYVDRFKYNSAEQNDVFQALQESVDKSPLISSLLPTSIKNILDTWTTQAGYPVLTVKSLNDNTLEISQVKFIDGDLSNPSDTWWVPIYLSPRPNNTLPEDFPDVWIPQLQNSITVNISTDQLIVVNSGSIGYYRVLYETGLFKRILNQLYTNHRQIPSVARSQILNDYFHFAISGYCDIETVLSLTAYLDKETELAVWQGVFPLLEKLSKLLIYSEFENDFKIYFGKTAWNAFQLVEKLNPSSMEKGAVAILRSNLMKFACSLENPECIENSKKLMHEWMVNRIENRIPVDIQEAIYCTGAAQDVELWEFLLSDYIGKQPFGSFSPNKTRLLKSLSCTKNRSNLRNLLNMIVSESSEVEKSEKQDVLSYFVNNPIGKDIVLELFQDSIELISLFNSNKELNKFLKIITSHILSEKDFETMQSVAERLSPDGEIILRNNLKKSQVTKEWFGLILQPLGNWLKLNLLDQ